MDTFDIGGALTVRRLGFGAMRVTGKDVLGEPADPEATREILWAAEHILHGVSPQSPARSTRTRRAR